MLYRKVWTSETEYRIQELFPDGRLRFISEDQPDYLTWLAKGNAPEEAAYVAPEPPTLDDAKAAKRAELMRARDEIIGEGFAYGGHTYPIRPDRQVTLLMQFTASQTLPAPSYAWKDMDGIYRDIGDAAAFQAFCTAAMLYGQSLFAREEMLQMLVNRAETVGEVEAITWDTVPEEEI